jgi:hypothetical protein
MSKLLSQFYTNFQTSSYLDKNKIPTPFDYDAYFGILNLDAESSPITDSTQEFIFVIDNSASMSDLCKDGETKIQHIQHTLINMVDYLCDSVNGLQVYVSIFIFNDRFEISVDRVLISKDNKNIIIQKIENIRPNGTTNIEKALTEVSKYINKLYIDFPSHNINHLFMTDGQVTDGSSNYKILKKLVTDISIGAPNECFNSVFVGFGIDHDSQLLNHISDNKNCSYYFIDAIERAGLVYGEILHSILYKIMNDAEITIHNGLIYDYKNNIWTNKLNIGNVISEVNKVYHLVSSEPHDCYAILCYKNTDIIDNSHNIDIAYRSNILFGLDIDHNKYIYRQQTLQLLNEVNCSQQNISNVFDTTKSKKQLKNKLKNFYNELKNFMKEKKMENDNFMKNLCDDIYICYKTFGTRYGNMYTTARQVSQGNQRFYSANQTPDFIQESPVQSYLFRRNNYNIYDRDIYFINQNDYDHDNDLITDHDVSNFIDTPYSTQTATFIMSKIGGNTFMEESENTQII